MAAKNHNGIRCISLRFQSSYPTENHCHHDHCQKRLDQRPGRTDENLFIANGNIAPGGDVEEFVVSLMLLMSPLRHLVGVAFA